MILVTGAAGKTGQAGIKSILERGQLVRAFVRNEQQRDLVQRLGVTEVVIGDLTKTRDIRQALEGVRRVLHICPNVHPDEIRIGTQMIEAAKSSGVEHFVFHSVMYPQIEAMPHHWKKMRVEERLIGSGLPFTIVQPASYMQNLALEAIRSEGILRVPYDLRSRHSMVDLMDVAEVYSRILVEPGHHYAIYDLAGPQALDHTQITATISQAWNREVVPVQESIYEWRQRAQSSGLSEYAVETLIKMFDYYDRHDFMGNPTVLGHLLQRPPTTLADWLNQVVAGS